MSDRYRSHRYVVAGVILVASAMCQAQEPVVADGGPMATDPTAMGDMYAPPSAVASTTGTGPTDFRQYEMLSREQPAYGAEPTNIAAPVQPVAPFRLFDELTFFGGIDGSKQPQDFGVNANLGGQVHVNWGLPLIEQWGLGMQLGTGLVASGNAVRVYDLLGETTGRTQHYTTLGVFQRCDAGFAWGVAYDWLREDSFDNFTLGQWRVRGQYDLGFHDQVGVTVNIADRSDNGLFLNSVPVTLRPITQGTGFWRHIWQTGTQTTVWAGVAEGHGENNAVTGPAPAKGESFVFGADILAPLNNYVAIYGETNLMMPADTGTVDAFLGLQFYPTGRAKLARRTPFAPLLPMAAPTTFSVDLEQ